jgi:hypothetical protein
VPKYIAARYNREELYDKAWKQPMTQLAKEHGISDVGMAKVFCKLYIPVPGRGYWAKKAASGKITPRKALPSIQSYEFPVLSLLFPVPKIWESTEPP